MIRARAHASDYQTVVQNQLWQMTCAGLCKIIAIPSLGIASFVAHRWPQVPLPSHLACKSLLVQVDQVHLSAHHFQSLGFEIWITRELWQKSLHCWCGWMESSEFTLLVSFLFLILYAYCLFFPGIGLGKCLNCLEESPLCQYKRSSISTSDHFVSGWLDLMLLFHLTQLFPSRSNLRMTRVAPFSLSCLVGERRVGPAWLGHGG